MRILEWGGGRGGERTAFRINRAARRRILRSLASVKCPAVAERRGKSLIADLTGHFRFMAQLSKYACDCDRKIKENESRRGDGKQRRKRERRECSAARSLSNFQFSQSGPKIRDRAPVMAEAQ